MRPQSGMRRSAPPGADVATDELARLRPAKVVLSGEGNVGQALGAARRDLDLAVDDIAFVTRVTASHISAIEAFDLDRLPARPFVIGYIRAYARALGLDAEMVVARFRAETPEPDTTLRPPAGLNHTASRRALWVSLAAGLILIAVVAWNVARHVTADQASARVAASAPRPHLPVTPPEGPAQLGAPPPAPPEATTPPAYVTPGLAKAVAAKDAAPLKPPAAKGAAPKTVAVQSTPASPVAVSSVPASMTPTPDAAHLPPG